MKFLRMAAGNLVKFFWSSSILVDFYKTRGVSEKCRAWGEDLEARNKMRLFIFCQPEEVNRPYF